MYILFWATDETSYDKFHSKLDRIFVVHAYQKEATGDIPFASCPPAVGNILKSEYPEVENSCRFISDFQEFSIICEDQKYIEKIAFADYSLFEIFSFPFIYGNAGETGTPDRIVLTQAVASKYFGNDNPTGKILHFDNNQDLTVVGVVKDIPHNSTISFGAIVPLENIVNHGVFKSFGADYLSSWGGCNFMTFGLLNKPEGFSKITSTITDRIVKEIPGSNIHLRAYKFKNRYLYEMNHIRNVRIFIIIAILVLLAALLNYINLNTARLSKQFKEIGIRKSIGASKLSLARLIYFDVAVVYLLAFVVSIVTAIIGLPLFNNIIEKNVDFTQLFALKPAAILVFTYLLAVVLTGCYPILSISKFSPAGILRSNSMTIKRQKSFRNSLVGAMFFVSIVLLASTLVISKQVHYMQKLDVGFDREQLMYINLQGELKNHCTSLKEEIEKSSDILSVAAVSHLPSEIWNNSDGWNWEGKDPNFKPLVTVWGTDKDFLKTFGTRIIEGSFFDKDQDGIVINKTFAMMIGEDKLIGKTLDFYGNKTQILGIVNDIRFNTLREETKPMVIRMFDENNYKYLIIKTNAMQAEKTISYIQSCCKSMVPGTQFDFGFINEEYDKMLSDETNLGRLVGIFSGFSMLVLLLGIFGVVVFMAEQKTKEIGIRKCMGEEVPSIVLRFIKPFIRTAILSGMVAIPLTWYIIDRWLHNYSSHIKLNIWIFLFAVFLTLALTTLIVCWQSWKAAIKNPVEALRHE